MEDGYKNYIIDYDFGGSKWSLNMPARSRGDVLKRLAAISETAVVFGYEVNKEKSSQDLTAFAT